MDAIITARKQIWGKVMFSQASVIPSVHRGGLHQEWSEPGSLHLGVCIHWRGLHPVGGSASRVGLHPTGGQSPQSDTTDTTVNEWAVHIARCDHYK